MLKMTPSRSAAHTMTRLKYLTVIAFLTCWIIAKVFLAARSFVEQAFLLLTAAYLLALLLLLLAAKVWRCRNEVLSPQLGWKFLLFGPSALAMIPTVTLMAYFLILLWLHRQNVPREGLSFEELRPFVRVLLLVLAGCAIEFYVIVGMAGLIIRLIHVVEDFVGRR